MHLGPEAERIVPPNNFATKSNIWNCIFKISKAKDYIIEKGQHEHNWCHEEMNVIKKLGLTCQNCLFILKVETVEILLLSNNMLCQFSLLEYMYLWYSNRILLRCETAENAYINALFIIDSSFILCFYGRCKGQNFWKDTLWADSVFRKGRYFMKVDIENTLP